MSQTTHPAGPAGLGTVHYLDDTTYSKWDNSHPPALEVDPGDTVVFKTRPSDDGHFTLNSTEADFKTLDWSRVHPLTGPVSVAGAEPGDSLRVEVLDIQHDGWAWTGIFPGLGLLHEEFRDLEALWLWEVGRDGRAAFKPGISVPVEPFCGLMGVAPKEPGKHSTLPARHIGGNLDIRHLCKGSVLCLPIEMPGALFSVGDMHLAQGDGEVCGTALETLGTVTLRLGLQKAENLTAPRYETYGPTTTKSDAFGHIVHTAIGQDMQHGAQNAVRDTMTYLQDHYDLTRVEAYFLCSAVGDLKISVPVLGDDHASVVSFHLPKSIFVD